MLLAYENSYRTADYVPLQVQITKICPCEVISQSPSVERAFIDAAKLFESLPVNLPISTALCWPLAILGTCARQVGQRIMFRQRLEDMYNFLKLGNIQETKRLLNIVLSKPRYMNVNPIDFEWIMRDEGLVILCM
jgi:hypothetical protein